MSRRVRRSFCSAFRQHGRDATVVVEQLVSALVADKAAPRHAGDLGADLEDVVLQLADPLAGLELGQTLPEHLADAVSTRRVPQVQDRVVPDGEGRSDRLKVAPCDL
jgi:hypothetical protein